MAHPFSASQSSVPIYDTRTRTVPIYALNVLAISEASAQPLFTVPDSCEVATVDRLAVRNDNGSPATLSLYTVPAGEAISSLYLELDAYSVPANTTVRIDELLGRAYAKGTACLVFSDTTGALSLRGMMTQER